MADAANREKIKEILRDELPVLRAKLGISQGTLADRIGISRQTYSSIETGKREMTWTTALALVAFFQRQDKTAPMIKRIDGLSEGLTNIMAYPEEKSR